MNNSRSADIVGEPRAGNASIPTTFSKSGGGHLHSGISRVLLRRSTSPIDAIVTTCAEETDLNEGQFLIEGEHGTFPG